MASLKGKKTLGQFYQVGLKLFSKKGGNNANKDEKIDMKPIFDSSNNIIGGQLVWGGINYPFIDFAWADAH